MKKTLLLLLILISITSCSEKEVLSSALVERNGIMHEVNNDNPFSGKVFDKYENQQFKMTGHYKKGLKTGIWEYFKDNGQIMERSNFSSGKLDGKYEKFNDKNILIEVKNYKQGKLNGLSEFFSEEKFKTASKEYKEGKLNGNYKNYDKDGKVTYEGNYIMGKKNGLWVSHNSDNSGVDENYKNGELNGEYKKYNSKKVIVNQGVYTNGKKTGKWVKRFNNDKIKSEIVFNENGKIKSYKEWNNNNNQLSRESVYPGVSIWYKNGKKIAEGYFRNINNLKESSLKIWQNNNLMTIATLVKYKWRGKYIRTGRGLGYFYHHFNYFEGKSHYRKEALIEERWTSTENSGRFNVDINSLPNFAIEVTPNGRSGKYITLNIRNWNGNSLNVNGQNWSKITKDY